MKKYILFSALFVHSVFSMSHFTLGMGGNISNGSAFGLGDRYARFFDANDIDLMLMPELNKQKPTNLSELVPNAKQPLLNFKNVFFSWEWGMLSGFPKKTNSQILIGACILWNLHFNGDKAKTVFYQFGGQKGKTGEATDQTSPMSPGLYQDPQNNLQLTMKIKQSAALMARLGMKFGGGFLGIQGGLGCIYYSAMVGNGGTPSSNTGGNIGKTTFNRLFSFSPVVGGFMGFCLVKGMNLMLDYTAFLNFNKTKEFNINTKTSGSNDFALRSQPSVQHMVRVSLMFYQDNPAS